MKTKDFIRMLQTADDDRGTEVRMLPPGHNGIEDVEIGYVRRVRSLSEPQRGEFVLVGDNATTDAPPGMFDIQRSAVCGKYWKRTADCVADDVLTRVACCDRLEESGASRLCEIVIACDAEIDKIFKQAAKAFEHLESPRFSVIAALDAKNQVRIQILSCNDGVTYDDLPHIKQNWNFRGKSDEEVYGKTDSEQGE